MGQGPFLAFVFSGISLASASESGQTLRRAGFRLPTDRMRGEAHAPKFVKRGANMHEARYTLIPSPLGEVLIVGDDAGLRRIVFQEGTDPLPPRREWVRDDRALRAAGDQIVAYFGEN
jgi:hypothetical protein